MIPGMIPGLIHSRARIRPGQRSVASLATHRMPPKLELSRGARNNMTLLAQTSCRKSEAGAGDLSARFEFTVPYRQFEPAERNCGPMLNFTITLTSASRLHSDMAELRAVASFLIDTTYGAASSATLTRMIGHYLFAADSIYGPVAHQGIDTITVSLENSSGDRASTRVRRPEFEVERTAFGAAHILHEDKTLGLYILEIAPHSTIPAHCHRVMRESEFILDEGLLQQGQPAVRGTAFTWPLGHVHAYRNPTSKPRRILCIDSPRFIPEDEVRLTAALVPLTPLVNYLA